MDKVIVLSGSIRKDSLNKKLTIIAASMLENLGIKTTYIDLADFEMPLYNGDLELKIQKPENAKRLKKLFIEHQGYVIASPEYNSSISPLLKNTIDWISRPDPSDPYPLVAFKDKFAFIMSASPGYMGGLRGLIHLRYILENIGSFVLPSQFTLAAAQKAFNEEGNFIEDSHKTTLEKALKEYSNFVRKLSK